MGNHIQQYRYYSNAEDPSWIKNLSEEEQPEKKRIFSESLILGDFLRQNVNKLKIETIQGVKFYLNHSIEPIIIDDTGIYEVKGEIDSLSFDKDSLTIIDNDNSSYLIINIVYK